ncbi:MAG: citrate transporter, partial [Clostridia bacterium]|nr:citrate transporter [Clostridia bacterium]
MLVVSAVLALVSCFLVPPSRAYVSYVDWRVLGLLFSLMAVVAGLRTAGTFRVLTEFLLRKVSSMRVIALLLVLLCFGFSMFLTNDVTLITLVPFTLLVFRQMTGSEKALVHTLVLETLAANLGSMLTPIGNPQNLYLYSQYDLSLGVFFRTMAPYTALSLVLLVVLTLVLVPGGAASLSEGSTFHSFHRKTFFVYAALFLLCLLSVARVLDWRVLLVAVLAVVVLENYRLLRMVDYSLLLTFVFFFVFIGNVGSLADVREFLENAVGGREVETGILASQVISNVPAALLLSKFTTDGTGLLVGV